MHSNIRYWLQCITLSLAIAQSGQATSSYKKEIIHTLHTTPQDTTRHNDVAEFPVDTLKTEIPMKKHDELLTKKGEYFKLVTMQTLD
jgi:hypothetical protein